MKIEKITTMYHGDFAKYMVDRFGFASFASELDDMEYINQPMHRYYSSINLRPANFEDFPEIVSTDSGTITIRLFAEVNEQTEIPELLEMYSLGDKMSSDVFKNASIEKVRNDNSRAFYIVNKDLTLTLIWTKEKGLVE